MENDMALTKYLAKQNQWKLHWTGFMEAIYG